MHTKWICVTTVAPQTLGTLIHYAVMNRKETCLTFSPEGDIIFIILHSKWTYSLIQREILLLSFKVFCYSNILKIGSGHKADSALAHKIYRNVSDLPTKPFPLKKYIIIKTLAVTWLKHIYTYSTQISYSFVMFNLYLVSL